MTAGITRRNDGGTASPRAPVADGFTLIELLVVIAVVTLLLGLLAPSLSGARDSARTAACLSNQRQLSAGWMLYSGDFSGRAMPLGDPSAPSGATYWWGAVVTASPTRIEHEFGFLAPYLDSGLHQRSVYECPAQPWGSYRPQPAAVPAPGSPTSTYGYNGYYLCPPMTPGWSLQIGRQPWKRIADIERPTELLVFADTLMEGSPPRNNALLDPPRLYSGNGQWTTNFSPTTCFRHGGGLGSPGAAAGARADGSVRAVRADAGWLTSPALRIGSVGTENDPCYVPDWKRWR